MGDRHAVRKKKDSKPDGDDHLIVAPNESTINSISREIRMKNIHSFPYC